MKKSIAFTLLFMLLAVPGYGLLRDNLIITMVTASPPGSQVSFNLFGFSDSVYVDFGDGVKRDFVLDFSPISGTVGATQIIRVYGDGSMIDFLDCSYMQLTVLDVTACPGLSQLFCNGNLLNVLDLSQSAALGSLMCMQNQLLSLDIGSCSNLTELDCNSNMMNHLAISDNSALISLNCGFNQLSNESLADLGLLNNLRVLDLSFNPISQLPDLSGLTQLWTISLDNCALMTLPDMPVSIQRIWASMESLEHLPELSSLVNLEVLSIVGSSVDSIPDMSANTRLESLRCWSGKLRSIPDLSAHPNVSQYYCRNNKLTFEDLEPNIGVSGFQYAPQDSTTFGIPTDTFLCEGHSITLAARVNGRYNNYQWYKEGVPFGDPSGEQEITLSDLGKSDEGAYHCVVTNSLVPGLTMTGAVSDSIAISMFENPAGKEGSSKVSGKVTRHQKLSKSTVIADPDVTLFLVDEETDLPVDFVGTDEEGYYKFTGVAAGDYSISVDLPGFDQNSVHSFSVSDTTQALGGFDYEVDTLGGFTISATGNSPTGITPFFSQIRVDLYPNPARDFLIIRSSAFIEQEVKFAVYAETGRRILSDEILSGKKVAGLSLSILDPGNYIIRFEIDGRRISKKFVVVR